MDTKFVVQSRWRAAAVTELYFTIIFSTCWSDTNTRCFVM